MSRPVLIEQAVQIAREAGKVLMKHYERHVPHRMKSDNSPVTAADEEAEDLILLCLRELAPQIPVIAEEQASAGKLPTLNGQDFFLVDPLDGTKEFLNKNGEFTVNIALVRSGVPELGVVYAPACQRLFWGANSEAFEEKDGKPIRIHARRQPTHDLIAVASRSHRDAETDAFLAARNITNTVAAGSSLKFCLLAAAEADIYPRMGPTMEWDTAAGDAVLRAAGGTVTLTDEITSLQYGKQNAGFRNPHFIAWGARS